MAMSDTAGSNSVSCCNMPDSSSQDDHRHHHHHHQSEPAARLPEYSQQPIDGIDTRVEMPSTALGSPSPTVPLRPPPKYEHPPPYVVDYTPGRGGASEARIHRIPDSTATAIRREFLRARTPGSNSYLPYIIFACVVFWLCGCVFGAVAFILAVMARRKSTSEAKRLARASLWVSVSGIVVGTILILFAYSLSARGNLMATCGTVWYESIDKWNDTEQATTSPEVTASACHVVDNDTTCFRFASSFTAELCTAVDGVIVNVSSSSSSTLPPPLAATAVSMICYHNACVNSYIVGTSCFQHRTPQLDRKGCEGINGYYVLVPSGRSCYYNDCPGFTTSNNKCYRYRKFIARAGCGGRDAFYEQGYCFYNSVE